MKQTGKYLLLIYWGICAVVYLTIDLCIDLYTANDLASVAWWVGALVLPLAVYTLYLGRNTFFTSWVSKLFFPIIVYGAYWVAAYFTTLNLDLLLSVATKSGTEQVLSVDTINKVFAGRAGFIHTNVKLNYQGKKVIFEGTRTSFFLLKDKKTISVAGAGRSYLGNDYITSIRVPVHERWAARWQYLKYWFSRYVWLLIIFPLALLLSFLKDKFFPAPASPPQKVSHPYRKFFDLLLIILLSIFGLFILILLLANFLL